MGKTIAAAFSDKVTCLCQRIFSCGTAVCLVPEAVGDESNGLWYELQGDYYIPCLTLSAEEEKLIGIWGQRHKRYLKEYKNVTYTTLLISGTLNSYLADINEQAENMLYRLVKEMATKENVTEQLKAEQPMLWVQLMNNIRNRAKEVVNSEQIYS